MTSDHDHDWGDFYCCTCGGSGTVYWNHSPAGDPVCVESAECPDCEGSGVETSDAQKGAA